MRVSDLGREFIKREEGLVLQLYRDVAGYATIGWGHLVRPSDDFGVVITEEKALELFEEDIADTERCINRYVEVNLNQHQHDGLASFVFNLMSKCFRREDGGRTDFSRTINSGDFEDVPRQMMRWVYAGDQDGDGDVDINDRVAGLMARREREGRLFATGEYGL